MRSHVDPEHAARLRAARAEEDAALALINARSAAMERARARRANALKHLDEQLDAANCEFVDAVRAFVHVAGVERASFALGMTPRQLRQLAPRPKAHLPASPER